MRYFLLLFLFLSVQVYAQKVEILLIGVSHNYANNPPQDVAALHDKIRQFKPTVFFGEFLSKEDEENNMDYWCKAYNLKRLEQLKKNRPIPAALLPAVIDSLIASTQANPNDYRLKADLAHAYYLYQDVSNAHYQYWQVLDHVQKKPDAALERYVDGLLSPALDVAGRSITRLKTSEYALLAFPMMLELKIDSLTPMDCQDFDLNWSAAALAFYKKFEPLKKDSSYAHADILKEILERRSKGFAQYTELEKTSKDLTSWLNTDEASTILSAGDFYFPDVYNVAGFPKEEMLAQIHWWLMRNKGMCENVASRARAAQQERVVVFVGANHRKYMQDIFMTMSDVSVRNINEI